MNRGDGGEGFCLRAYALDVPVVVISACKDLPERANKLDVAGHLEKPVKLAALLRLVREHCPIV